MAYRSIFQPISAEELNKFNQSRFIAEGEFYDPRAIFEENQVVTQQPAQAQVQQPVQPQQQPVQPIQAQQPAQGNMVQFQVTDPTLSKVFMDNTWKAFQAQPSIESLKPWVAKVYQFLGMAQQQPAQPAQPQQPVQNAQPQQQVAESYRKYRRVFESEDDGSDDDEPKKEAPKKSEKSESSSSSSSSSSKSGDFNDTKEVKYDSTYKKDDGGNETDFGWDKQMRDSIFGDKDNPFKEDNEVKYDSAYDKRPDDQKETPMWDIKTTNAEPYNPEKPSFTSLSNPNALSKTVFTTGDVKIKDAPTVAPSAPVAGTGNGKSEGSKKTEKDDGSDDANESFSTNYDAYLNESIVDDKLKEVIVQEFLNANKGVFDIKDFSEWIEDNYPQISSDASAFDELSSNAQSVSDAHSFTEDEEIDVDDEEIEDKGSEVIEEVTLDDAVDEYLEQYSGVDYDEDDAIAWADENYELDDETMEDFLDLVAEKLEEDDINESFDDEFFANEPALNE